MTMKNKRRLKNLLRYLVLTYFLALAMFPFVWMPLTPLGGPRGKVYAFPVRYMPNPASIVNYVTMLQKDSFDRYALNSFFSSAAVATYTVFIAILTSYVVDRFHFRFKNVLLLSSLVTQMAPILIMLAPLYQLLAKTKMLDDLRNPIMFYTNMMILFSVVTLCSFLDSVPKSLEEAIWIDGYDYFKALFKVVVPVIVPGTTAMFILVFISSRNELFMIVTFIGVDKFKAVLVGPSDSTLKYDIKWGEVVTGTTISLVLTMRLFVFAQKYMIKGLTTGSAKD